MTQILLAINATLIFLLGALPQIPSSTLGDDLKTVISLAVGAALAFLGPLLPKVSEAVRGAMQLRVDTRQR